MIIRLLLVISSVLLAGCSAAPPVPTNSFYRLDIAAPGKRLAAPLLDGTLSVQVGAAIPLYRDRALLHSDAGAVTTLQRYHYHYWVDTPPHLLQVEFADYLRDAGIADVVVMPEDSVDTVYRLRLDIDHFEHLRGPGGGTVRVGLRVLLTERSSGKLLLQDRLEAEAQVRGDDFPQLALSYQQAVSDIGERIVELLRAVRIQ
ncbi:MAG: membrane integrity-associated transporter subunit PqiC [Gammaproteobacteria bacterium]|nr:membrane integrity-associated transporter subunit PqiC [Gammaproteobacteria bacterium]MBU2477695.1 membrane integrity-associated transporter subunit PqiC [Gammaproteobacteria bacterium]